MEGNGGAGIAVVFAALVLVDIVVEDVVVLVLGVDGNTVVVVVVLVGLAVVTVVVVVIVVVLIVVDEFEVVDVDCVEVSFGTAVVINLSLNSIVELCERDACILFVVSIVPLANTSEPIVMHNKTQMI